MIWEASGRVHVRGALMLAAGAVLVALVIVLLWPEEDWGVSTAKDVEEPSWADEEALRVRVVERESGACVPGATVIVSKRRRTLSHPQGFPLRS